jgi:hypothetical protein
MLDYRESARYSQLRMKGPEHIRDWMRRRGFNQADAARYLGWNEAYLCRLLSEVEGTKKGIGLDNALHLETLTGIPVEAWKSNEVDESETVAAGNGGKRKVSR